MSYACLVMMIPSYFLCVFFAIVIGIFFIILYHWLFMVRKLAIVGIFTFHLLLLLSCFSHARLCATPETAAHQAPPSLGFSRQEHWSGLPFPSPMHEREK